MRYILLIIVLAIVGLSSLFAEGESDLLAKLQQELESAQQELETVRAKEADLAKKCSALKAKIMVHSYKSTDEAETKKEIERVKTEITNTDNLTSAEVKDIVRPDGSFSTDQENEKSKAETPLANVEHQQDATKEMTGGRTEVASGQSDKPSSNYGIIQREEASLDFALVPNAELVLYHDKAFLQAGFNKSVRETLTEQLKQEFSYEVSESACRYSESFSNFNFLYSVNATQAIDKDGSKITYEQIDWMMGWEADRPADIWDEDPKKAVITALELTQLVHRGLMTEILNPDIRMKLRIWEFKSSLVRDRLPGWTLYSIRCYPTVTTRYDLLWAVADNRQLFFLGPAETVRRRLKAKGNGSQAAKAIYAQLRTQADGHPCLATALMLKEGAVKKIENLMMDFRRPGDMALMQYLRRTTDCQLLLTAKEAEMLAHLEVTFRDAVVSKDFHNLLKQMTVPVILVLFVKADLGNLTSVKEVEVESKNSSTVTLDTHMPFSEFCKILASQEVVRFPTGSQENQ